MILMPVIVLLLAVLLLYGVQVAPTGQLFEKPLSLEHTKMIKGICAVEIVLDHLSAAMPGIIWLKPFHTAGFLAVAIFFFLSGYGLEISKNTKANYLHRFLPNRLISIYIPLFLSNAIYILPNMVEGQTNPWYIWVLKVFDIVGLWPLNGTSWFLVNMGYFYVMYYLINRFAKPRYAILLMSTGIAGFVAAKAFFGGGRQSFGMCFAFIAGILWCRYEAYIISRVKKHFYSWLLVFTCISGVFLMIYYLLYDNLIGGQLFARNIGTTAFSFTFALLLLKVKFGNPIIAYIGGISTEVYLLHMFAVRILRSVILNVSSNEMYFVTVFAVTIILAFFLWKLDQLIIRRFKIAISPTVKS